MSNKNQKRIKNPYLFLCSIILFALSAATYVLKVEGNLFGLHVEFTSPVLSNFIIIVLGVLGLALLFFNYLSNRKGAKKNIAKKIEGSDIELGQDNTGKEKGLNKICDVKGTGIRIKQNNKG